MDNLSGIVEYRFEHLLFLVPIQGLGAVGTIDSVKSVGVQKHEIILP